MSAVMINLISNAGTGWQSQGSSDKETSSFFSLAVIGRCNFRWRMLRPRQLRWNLYLLVVTCDQAAKVLWGDVPSLWLLRLVSSGLHARKVFSWWLCQRRTRRPTVALKIVTHVSQILIGFLFLLTPWRTWRTNKHQFEVFLCSVLFLNSYKCRFCEPFSWSLTQCPGTTLGMFSFFPPSFHFL